jgi:aerobic carbon-monoxide dehydrogenase small subunit
MSNQPEPQGLMMARDILRRIENPDAEIVRAQLSGQIYRCTGYAGIVKAIVGAGKEIHSVRNSGKVAAAADRP